mmetsp:Transcript_51153/g.121564  ORF Transcript_51153/g.121564 Transcript_51153/m.121564 type:complete len:383 (-) Transcript_51153:159-1307(-)
MGVASVEHPPAPIALQECTKDMAPLIMDGLSTITQVLEPVAEVSGSDIPLNVLEQEDQEKYKVKSADRMTQAVDLKPWEADQFDFKHVVMPALRCGGQIELYVDRITGEECIVKRVPYERLGNNRAEFKLANPHDLEDPWKEMEIATKYGTERHGALPGICRCYGLYKDTNGDALIMFEHLAGGDLFNVAQRRDEPGAAREAAMWPLVKSLLNTVLSLHSFGVAHGDISLENAVLRGGPESTDVVLIDFAMSCTDNIHTATSIRGKPSYQAPEMYTHSTYDMCCADLFACGVVAYSLAVRGYPWSLTRPGADPAFTFAMMNGVRSFLKKRRVNGNGSPRVSDVLSPRYRTLLEYLLHPDPSQRHRALEVFRKDWTPEGSVNE